MDNQDKKYQEADSSRIRRFWRSAKSGLVRRILGLSLCSGALVIGMGQDDFGCSTIGPAINEAIGAAASLQVYTGKDLNGNPISADRQRELAWTANTSRRLADIGHAYNIADRSAPKVNVNVNNYYGEGESRRNSASSGAQRPEAGRGNGEALKILKDWVYENINIWTDCMSRGNKVLERKDYDAALSLYGLSEQKFYFILERYQNMSRESDFLYREYANGYEKDVINERAKEAKTKKETCERLLGKKYEIIGSD